MLFLSNYTGTGYLQIMVGKKPSVYLQKQMQTISRAKIQKLKKYRYDTNPDWIQEIRKYCSGSRHTYETLGSLILHYLLQIVCIFLEQTETQAAASQVHTATQEPDLRTETQAETSQVHSAFQKPDLWAETQAAASQVHPASQELELGTETQAVASQAYTVSQEPECAWSPFLPSQRRASSSLHHFSKRPPFLLIL